MPQLPAAGEANGWARDGTRLQPGFVISAFDCFAGFRIHHALDCHSSMSVLFSRLAYQRKDYLHPTTGQTAPITPHLDQAQSAFVYAQGPSNIV